MPMPAARRPFCLLVKGCHFSHDALLWWDLLITLPPSKYTGCPKKKWHYRNYPIVIIWMS
jgi:hypothetical protein